VDLDDGEEKAVLMPKCNTPFAASRALIIWNHGGNVDPGGW
jgi:hypothetical protein